MSAIGFWKIVKRKDKQINELQALNIQMHQIAKNMKKDLEEYGNHKIYCRGNEGGPCSCGFQDMLRKWGMR